MHVLKSFTWLSHTLGAVYAEFIAYCPSFCCARGWSAGAAAASLDEEPLPPNHPPTAWPIEEPTATPLSEKKNGC